MGLPIITTSGNGFLKSGTRWQIKGVAYRDSDSDDAAVDVLTNAKQCAVDAPLIKALGANTITVGYLDPTKNHDSCMKTFEDNEIYVVAPLADTNKTANNEQWDMTQYKRFSAVVDAMAGYDNLLGLLIGDDVIDYSTSGKDDEDTLAPSLKAAVRDMKAYSAARDYRTIPFGYFGNDDATIREALANYLVCGGNSSETIDFYGLNLFSWCGDSSYAKSGYDGTNSRFGALGVPVFLSEDGCNVIRPRKFTDQAVVFGSEMSGNWSGAVIYEWRETEYEYGLANYTSTAPASGASTPTLLPDYTNLKSQWASVTSNTHSPTTFATPSCPSQSSSYWTLDPSVTLPTIAGLNIATITPTSESATPTTVSSSTSTPEPTQHSESGLSGGSKAGIGVGVGGGVLLIVVVVVLFFYRRRKNALSNSPDQGSTVELPVATPTAELPGMGIVAQLPGSGNVAEMNAGDATHVNELQGSDPWNGPHELNDSSVHESSDGQRTSLGTQPASPGMAPARTETRP